MSKPIAVLISDIHFTPATLELAALSFLRAQFKAKLLNVPLVVAGDTLDTKAVMRAECVNRLLELVSVKDAPEMIFIVGNHEMINERGNHHTLHFLKPYATIIDHPQQGMISGEHVLMIPYQSNPEILGNLLSYDDDFAPPKLIIMHQGLKQANSGEYGDRDKSAIEYEDVKDFRVISGHYHTRQDIKTGRARKGAVGLFSYIGNPYTVSFGEAKDPEKGYQILHDDGTLEFVPTSLRKHIIFDMSAKDVRNGHILVYNQEDLLWLKITGTKEELGKLTREVIISKLNLNAAQIRIDLIPTTMTSNKIVPDKIVTDEQTLDALIDACEYTNEQKTRLKKMWREV